MSWMEKYPAQLVSVAIQIAWTAAVERSLEASGSPDIVLQDLNPVTRRKCEHVITEPVH